MHAGAQAALKLPAASATRWLFLWFALSGAAGLIYQSTWTYYLGLLLGHAAYAQAGILVLFMGGLAGGAAAAARWSHRVKSPLRAYAAAEIFIAAWGLAFHFLFDAVAPNLGELTQALELSQRGAQALRWIVGVALVLPGSLALGATFPLIASSLSGSAARATGGLYFFNSLGAAAGALLAAFLLLPRLGMPGALAVAAGANLVAACGALWLTGRTPSQRGEWGAPAAVKPPAWILLVAALTGASSFAYEIVWVHWLNEALGTSIHSFELMLAAFILGLALGGLYVSRRTRPATAGALGWMQILMGACALLSIVAFSQSFSWVNQLVNHANQLPDGYATFLWGSGVVAMLIMLPAAFFAGTTLPLLTMLLLQRGGGEAAFGKVYAFNTLGAIAGVVAALHLGIPELGLTGTLQVAAGVDLVIGIGLLLAARRKLPVITGALLALLAVAATLGHRTEPGWRVIGAFFGGNPTFDNASVAFLREGKTSTVGVVSPTEGMMTIVTNGKPDAAMTLDLEQAPTVDEPMMYLLALGALASAPNPERVAVIGWGSGLTTHAILGDERIKEVSTIEIEPMMHEGAKLFGPRVARAYQDPRSSVVFDDARSYLSSSGKKWDAIVSEPSNTWVSGVSNLFTRQFYRQIKPRLNKGGVVIQWIHAYQINDSLLMSMVASLQESFPYTEVYASHNYDLVFVARAEAPAAGARFPSSPALLRELERVGMGTQGRFELTRLAGPGLLRALVRQSGAVPYQDYYPTVALEGPHQRFLNSRSFHLERPRASGMPVADLLDNWRPPSRAHVGQHAPTANRGALRSGMMPARRRMGELVADLLQNRTADPDFVAMLTHLKGAPKAHIPEEWTRSEVFVDHDVARLKALSAARVAPGDIDLWARSAASAARSIGALPATDLVGAWIRPGWINASDQPVAVHRLLAAYEAAALRDAGAMARTGQAALRLELPPEVREQMLVIAQLGALGTGDTALQAKLAEEGRSVAPDRLAQVRETLEAARCVKCAGVKCGGACPRRAPPGHREFAPGHTPGPG